MRCFVIDGLCGLEGHTILTQKAVCAEAMLYNL